VGRSNWAADDYLNGDIAGLYAIDALLSETQIEEISNVMYTSVTPRNNNNIDPMGYFVNAATLMTYTHTPTAIPALAGTSGNIFTTSDMVCASTVTSATRRLLDKNLQDGNHGIPNPVKSTRRAQRIYPLPQHGRKNHGVYTPDVKPVDDTILREHSAVPSFGAAKTPSVKSSARSGPRRMLFSTAARPATETDNETVPEAREKFAASAREITAINNNRQITDLLCGRAEHGNTCDMLSVKKEVGIAEFCMREADFMQLAAADIRAQLLEAASSAVTEITITSIVRPGAYYKCKSTAIRRLLQTEIIIITYVTRATQKYFVSLDILLDTGFSGLKRLTALDGTKLAICTSVSTLSKASVSVSVDGQDQDRVCEGVFVSKNGPNATTLSNTMDTVTTYFNSSHNVQVTVAKPEDVNVHVEDVIVRAQTTSISSSVPVYAIALGVCGAVLFVCVACCCVRRHNYTKVSKNDTTPINPQPFLDHGQDYLHPHAFTANMIIPEPHHW